MSPFKFLLPEYDNILFCKLHRAFIILISHDSREPFQFVSNAAYSLQGPVSHVFLVLPFFTPIQSTITVLFLDCTGKMKDEHSVKFESQQPSIGQQTSRNSTATSKAVLPTMQPRYHTKIPSIKGKFCKDIRDIFLERQKKCYVPCFSTYLMPTRYVIA